MIKNSQICIQTVKFEFKWTNKEATPHYRPPQVVPPNSSASATARTRQAIGLAPAQASTLAPPGGTALAVGATAFDADGVRSDP
jgi:hypothetical protein